MAKRKRRKVKQTKRRNPKRPASSTAKKRRRRASRVPPKAARRRAARRSRRRVRKNPAPARVYTVVFDREAHMEPVLRTVSAKFRRELAASIRRRSSGGVVFDHPKFRGTEQKMHHLKDQVESVLAYDAGRRRGRFEYGQAVKVKEVT